MGDIHSCEPWLYSECLQKNINVRAREWRKNQGIKNTTESLKSIQDNQVLSIMQTLQQRLHPANNCLM